MTQTSTGTKVVDCSNASPRAQPTSWRNRAVTSARWWAAVYPLQKLIQIGGSVVLAALLSPAIFGLMAIGNTLLQGLRMFSELGLKPAILSSHRGDEQVFLNTAWTLAVLRGGMLALLMVAAAWPMAAFYGEPVLLALIPVLALNPLIGGFRSTRMISHNRQLREGPLAMLELTQSVVSRAAMIGWALIFPSVWALAGGSLIGSGTLVLLSHLALPGIRNRFRLDRAAVRELLQFGVWIFVGTIVAFFASQLDRIMLPKLDGMAALGIYTIAWTIAMMPRELANLITTKIMFPLMARIAREDHERFAQRLRWLRSGILPATLCGTLGMMLIAGWFFELLYDHRYADAMWMAPLLGLVAWVGVLNRLANRALLSVQQSRPLAVSGTIKLALMVIAPPIGYLAYAIPGFILGVVFAAFAEHVYDLVVLARRRIDLATQDIRYTGILMLLASVGLGGRYLVIDQARLALSTTIALDVGLTTILLAGTAGWAASAIRPLIHRTHH